MNCFQHAVATSLRLCTHQLYLLYPHRCPSTASMESAAFLSNLLHSILTSILIYCALLRAIASILNTEAQSLCCLWVEPS